MPKILIFFLSLSFLLCSCSKSSDPLDQLSAGSQVPDEVHAVIEISAQSSPVKYEMNKKTGQLFVDRFLKPGIQYPTNYGYIPQTLSEDGDPADILVITPYPVISGAVVRARPIGVLKMEDEAGNDFKIIAVPTDATSNEYAAIQTIQDLDPNLVNQIENFFLQYKNEEKGKWVKLHGWADEQAAKQEIIDSIERFKK